MIGKFGESDLPFAFLAPNSQLPINESPNNQNAQVAQRKEAPRSEREQCGFESHPGYKKVWADNLANPKKSALRMRSAHIEWRVWRNGSVTVFQTEGAGSNPATRTGVREA